MNIAQIETKLQNIIDYFNQFEFVYSLLEAYNVPKSSITRLKKGNLNLSKVSGELIWKKKLYFKEEFMFDLHETILIIKDKIKHKERFVIVTDYKTFLAIDTVTEDKLDIELKDLPKHYDFFLPWAGMEKTTHANENPADVKAAERMAKLFDEIKKENPDDSPEFVHSLNIFLSRLLFCFFAEDTNIFGENQFTNAISSHTEQDGSDLDVYLDNLFEVLNTSDNKRKNLPSYLESFPYVNGGLFKEKIKTPKFNRKSRQAIIDSGELVWADINPDIFGSMFQAVITEDQRGTLGQHYTSVPNIMKVIEPLFLNDLKEDFEKATGNIKKLNELTQRIQKIKVFDSACGSGNFLIIAYKELRKLEIEIFAEIDKTQGTYTTQYSLISLNNFYGIELDDFAHEIAKLALWLAEHQMNMEFFKAFGKTNPTLPLRDAGQITCGNACRLDWEVICPKDEEDEIYILGNPPYLGARMQDADQKMDMDIVFHSFTNYRDLDYIACWFYKGAKYIKDINAKVAFVSTNSICQGLQVGLLWPSIFDEGIEIDFAHTSFKWKNNAKANAAVIVVIVGLTNENEKLKSLYNLNLEKKVKNINAYLSDGESIAIVRRSKPLSFPFEMSFGNMPNDGGGLILSTAEKEQFLKEFPEGKLLVKNLLGAAEFIQGKERFCLWIKDSDLVKATKSEFVRNRIKQTQNHRLKSRDKGTQELSKRSHQFRDTNVPINSQILIPRVSSERRKYIPSGYLDKDSIISDSAQVIYDGEPWLMSVLTSKMHMIWLHNVGGKLKSDYRYSKDIVYNTFPFPKISKQRKDELTQSTFNIIEEREKHSDKTLAELYDPNKMPKELMIAHKVNDELIEKCYRVTPFRNDEERLEYLFNQYVKMIQEEQNSSTLFEKQKKKRKKK